jgi:hypothetical protein
MTNYNTLTQEQNNSSEKLANRVSSRQENEITSEASEVLHHNYKDLPQEQKESITPYLKGLFERRNEFMNFKNYHWLEKTINEIKGFKEGLKIAIKKIDEEIEFLRIIRDNYSNIYVKVNYKLEELKVQRDKLQFEVELE